MDEREIFLASMARELHRAGMATDAIEQTLTTLARSIGLETQIFALPTYITIAAGPTWQQRVVMMRLEPGRVSLRRIAHLNDIYNELRAGRIDYREAAAQLASVDKRWPALGVWWEVPALLFIAVGVAIILGGGSRELEVAALIGVCTGILSALAAGSAIVARLFDVIASFVAILVIAAFTRFVGPANLYISLIAGIVVLLPGYSLTLALHELANDFLVAGVARLGKVLAILLALGCGAFLALALVGASLLGTANVQPHPPPATFWVVASACMAIGLSIDLDARLRDFAWVFAACFVALLAQHLIGDSPARAISPFLSALVCGVVANLGARWLRVPQAIMLIPALTVMVPGSLSYQSVLFAFQQNIDTALTLATNAAFAAIQLVAGLLLSQLMVPAAALRVRARARAR
ncbi:MAG TPA: threonine/serine exporter family protein [Verrucomicrobiae bacterium]|nr:threonine/serine exporter family protein [Verrucomicrobiae bacterium]